MTTKKHPHTMQYGPTYYSSPYLRISFKMLMDNGLSYGASEETSEKTSKMQALRVLVKTKHELLEAYDECINQGENK